MRKLAWGANLLLVAFLLCLAITTAAQVRHNQAQGAHGHAPHDKILAPGRPATTHKHRR